MNEFEKWNTKTMPKISPLNLAHSVLFIKEQRKEGWKAALEWALSNETSVAYSIPVILTDVIEKELEQLKNEK